MRLNDYTSPTCVSMHKAGERIALCVTIIGVVCVLLAIGAAAFDIHVLNQLKQIVNLNPRIPFQGKVDFSAFGTKIEYSPVRVDTMIFFALLKRGLVALVGLTIIAFGRWLKWFLIGRAEALDAQTRIAIAKTRNQQQQ